MQFVDFLLIDSPLQCGYHVEQMQQSPTHFVALVYNVFVFNSLSTGYITI